MTVLLEYRKVNDTNVPLYFKFGTVPTKDKLTSDKFITLENWMHIFDELNPVLASGCDSNSSKKSKSFDLDNGRLTVKTKWIKLSDVTDVGNYILKILHLSSSNVGKYFLRIDVKLGSYLERLESELEQKNKSPEIKTKSKGPKQTSHNESNSTKHGKIHIRKISDMLPKITKEKHDSSSLLNDSAACNGLDDVNVDLNHFEEYVPVPVPAPVATSFRSESPTSPTYNPSEISSVKIENDHSEYSPTYESSDKEIPYEPSGASASTPIYKPEKNVAQIEMNLVKSEYSPTPLNPMKVEEEVSYKPTIKRSQTAETDKPKKKSDKKNRLEKSLELFGLSDDSDNDDRDTADKVSSSSSSNKAKRKKDSTSRREKKSSHRDDGSKSKKKKLQDVESSQDSLIEVGDISIRNLMNDPIKDILATYSEHESYLTELYDNHIKVEKRSYKPKDIPDMAALDIVSTPQFTAMISFLEEKLVRDAEEEHNYSDVIFDLLIPEWAFGIFCKKFHYSRSEALERLRMQSIALSNSSQL